MKIVHLNQTNSITLCDAMSFEKFTNMFSLIVFIPLPYHNYWAHFSRDVLSRTLVKSA